MKLKYKAALQDGKIFEGLIEARDPKEAAFFLRKKNLLPIFVKEVQAKSLLTGIPFLRTHSLTDIILFTRQLSSMLISGLTLMQALVILKNQVQNDAMNEAIKGMILEIEDGKAFSTALAKYPEIFSPIYISLVRAGESSGFLEKILLRLGENLEKEQKLHTTIRSALLYPLIIVCLMVVVISLMMIVVIPKLNGLYQNIGIPLPLITQVVIDISNFMVMYWPLLLVGIILFAILFRRWSSSKKGKKFLDTWILKLPVLGKLISQTIVAEVSRTLGLLVGSGTLVTQSLQETAEVATNIVYRNAILEIAQDVEKGVSIGNAMAGYPIFPPILTEMVKIGEKTGKLDESLLKVAEYFDREVEVSVKTLTTAMEPLIMVVLGLGVAFLIISVITPIYTLTTSIK